MRNLLLCLVAAAALAIGCDSKESSTASTATPGGAGSSAPSGKKLTIAMLPKKTGIPYFTTCSLGAKEAAAELGHELIYDGPSDGAAEKSASMIEQWTLQGVDVIAVAVSDPDVLAPAMKNARDKGVKVITWDADGAPGTRDFFVNQATAKDIGVSLVDTLAKDIGGGDAKAATGEVAIITGYLTAANQNDWMKYMKEHLAATYPNLKLVEVKPCDEDQKKAYQVSQDLMKAYPNLKGIWAITSVAFPGVAEAIKASGKKGVVQVTGLSTPNDMKPAVMEGTVKSVILWNTVDLGYLTIQTAQAVANGTIQAGDKTIKAGRLGEKEIAGDNVLLGKIMVFTKDNIEKYDF